jgi:hypothetical protein
MRTTTTKKQLFLLEMSAFADEEKRYTWNTFSMSGIQKRSRSSYYLIPATLSMQKNELGHWASRYVAQASLRLMVLLLQPP